MPGVAMLSFARTTRIVRIVRLLRLVRMCLDLGSMGKVTSLPAGLRNKDGKVKTNIDIYQQKEKRGAIISRFLHYMLVFVSLRGGVVNAINGAKTTVTIIQVD